MRNIFQTIFKRRAFFLKFNGRDDNLGDQFITKALAEELTKYGGVFFYRELPEFVEKCSGIPRGKITKRFFEIFLKLFGIKKLEFAPPGGLTWPKATRGRASVQNYSRGSTARIAVGRSVIPKADHYWVNRFELVGVRDNASLDVLSKIVGPKCIYFPDLAFLPAISCGQTSTNKTGQVGFSFRECIPELSDQDYGGEIVGVSARIADAIRPQVSGLSCFFQVEDDQLFCEKIAKKLSIRMKSEKLDLDTFQEFYGKYRFVFSNRLHVLLLAARCGAIPIAVANPVHSKLYSIFQTLEWKHLILDKKSAKCIRKFIDEIVANESMIRNEVSKKISAQRTEAQAILAKLVKDRR